MASASWRGVTTVAFGCSRGTVTISPTASPRSSRRCRTCRRALIEKRKAALAELLRGTHGGIAFNQHYEAEDAIIYKHDCALVSKSLGSPYRAGRADCWVKVKNPSAPAVRREAEEDWGDRPRRRADGPAKM